MRMLRQLSDNHHQNRLGTALTSHNGGVSGCGSAEP